MATVKIGTTDVDEKHLVGDLEKKYKELLSAQLDSERLKLLSGGTPAKDTALEVRQQEIDRIKKDNELLELRKKAIEAQLPATQTAALTGSIVIDEKAFIEPAIVAYRQLDPIAARMVADFQERLKDLPAPVILIVHSEADAAALNTFRAFEVRAQLLLNEFRDLASASGQPALAFAPLLSIGVATVGLKAVADLLALFRVDSEIKGRAVPVGQEELLAALARSVLISNVKPDAHKINLVYPPLMPPERPVATSPVLTTLATLEQERERARVNTQQTGAGVLSKRFASADETYLAFRSALMVREQNATRSPFDMALRGSELGKLLDSGALFLQAKVVASGGSYLLTKTLFRGSHLRQSGGVVVSYIVADRTGCIRAAGVHGEHGTVDNLTLTPKIS